MGSNPVLIIGHLSPVTRLMHMTLLFMLLEESIVSFDVANTTTSVVVDVYK